MPIKKSLGFEATLVKSFTVKDAPSPSMINDRAIGAIVVTMFKSVIVIFDFIT